MTKALTTTPADTAVASLSPDFEHARKLQRQIRLSMMSAAGFMVLYGLELKRLKKAHGVKRGGNRRGTDQTQTGLGLIRWEDIVKAELGISDETAAKYILMAEAAKSRVPILQALEAKLLDAPLSSLSIEEQADISKAVQKLTDGQTAKEVMQEMGIAKQDPGKNLDKDRNKGGNSTSAVITPEQEAQEWFGSVTETMIGLRAENTLKWGTLIYSLPLARDPEVKITGHVSLEDLETELTNWLNQVKEARTRIARAMHASKTKDAAAREAEAKALILEGKANDAAVSILIETEQHESPSEAIEAATMHGKEKVTIVANRETQGRVHILVTDEERAAWSRLHGTVTHLIYEGPGKSAAAPLIHALAKPKTPKTKAAPKSRK
jgi:hypothetical protein